MSNAGIDTKLPPMFDNDRFRSFMAEMKSMIDHTSHVELSGVMHALLAGAAQASIKLEIPMDLMLPSFDELRRVMDQKDKPSVAPASDASVVIQQVMAVVRATPLSHEAEGTLAGVLLGMAVGILVKQGGDVEEIARVMPDKIRQLMPTKAVPSTSAS